MEIQQIFHDLVTKNCEIFPTKQILQNKSKNKA